MCVIYSHTLSRLYIRWFADVYGPINSMVLIKYTMDTSRLLKVLVTTIDALGLLNRIITAQWEGMGDVGSARYELALLPACPTIKVLSYSICQEIHPLHFQVDFQKLS